MTTLRYAIGAPIIPVVEHCTTDLQVVGSNPTAVCEIFHRSGKVLGLIFPYTLGVNIEGKQSPNSVILEDNIIASFNT